MEVLPAVCIVHLELVVIALKANLVRILHTQEHCELEDFACGRQTFVRMEHDRSRRCGT